MWAEFASSSAYVTTAAAAPKRRSPVEQHDKQYGARHGECPLLPGHRNGVRYVFGHGGAGLRRAMPHAAAVGGDVDHLGIHGVHDHAVAPFECVAADALPGRAAIGGAPGRGVETACVEHAGILRVHRDVVDVTVDPK